MHRKPAPILLALTADGEGAATSDGGYSALLHVIENPAELLAADLDLDALLAGVRADESVTDEQIGELEAALLGLFDGIRAGDVEGIDPRDVSTLTRIADAVTAVGVLASERIAAAEAVDAELAALDARLSNEAPPEPAATDEATTTDEATDEAATTTDEAATTDEATAPAEPEAVAAGGATLPTVGAAGRYRNAARTRTPAQARRTEQPRPSRVSMVATSGGALPGMQEVARELSDRFRELGANAGKRVIARIEADYPEERQLTDSLSVNRDRIDAVVAAAEDPAAWTPAVVAAGGWCAPSPIDYRQVVQAIADRPVANSLPDFTADRGGVQVPVSPTLSVINVSEADEDTDAAIRIWTEQDDIDALEDDGPRKPVQRIDCNTWVDFRLYAVTRRLRFGNMASRANPENVASWNQLLMAAYARRADSQLLTLMKADAGTTEVDQPTPVLGAARDVAELVLRLATFMRSAERANPEARIHGWFPAWLIALMQADLIRAERDTVDLTVARDVLVRQFANAGINPTFYIDTPLTGPSQLLGKQTNDGEARAWPCAVQFGLAFEGHFGYMNDGGIDLGVWRDRDLNEVNDYETFAEGVEGIYARRGPEALWVTQDLVANGTSSSSIDISELTLCTDATSA